MSAVPGTIRAVPWAPLLGAAALALTMVHFGSHDPGPLMLSVHLGAVLLCAGAAYVVDDPAAGTLACSPTALLGRRTFRVGAAVVVAGVAWAALLVEVRWAAGPGGWPPASLTLQAAALLAAGLSLAVLGSQIAPDGRGGVAGSTAVLVLALVSVALPEGWSPLALGEGGSSARPALLLAGGVVVFLLASLDPARRSARPRRRGKPRRGVA